MTLALTTAQGERASGVNAWWIPPYDQQANKTGTVSGNTLKISELNVNDLSLE